MMRSVWFLVMCLGVAATTFGRLGDTLDQAEARYGLEKKPKVPIFGKLLEGSREVFFEFEGWRIRCALLQATDTQFYVVREEYTKAFNGEIMKAGGTPQIRDFERDTVLKAEGGDWLAKEPAQSVPNLSVGANQLLRAFGLVDIHVRSDGATTHMNPSHSWLILQLPQALNYEAQMKGISSAVQTTPTPSRFVASPPPSQLPHATPTRISTPSVSPIPNLWSVVGLAVLVAVGELLRTTLRKRSKKSTVISGRSKEGPPSIPASNPTSDSRPRAVKDLTWDEFELLVGEIYRRQGYTVELSAGTGADGGIDLLLLRDGQRILVQCKSWNVYKVAAPAIREFYGVLVSEKADRGIFVTTGQYTRDAKEFSEGKPIKLIDGSAFQSLLQDASSDPNDDLLNVGLWAPVFFGASKVTIPPCPFCKATMVKREGRTGTFFGCPTYPRCNGKREIRRHVNV